MRLFILLVLLAVPLGTRAQPLTWETVGAEESRSEGPPLVRPDSSLLTNGFYWHPDGYVNYGPLRLDAPWGPGEHWTQPYPRDTDASQDAFASFHPDTVFTYQTSTFSRSLDGGVTFERLPEPAACQWSRLVEIPTGPYAGRLVCGHTVNGTVSAFVTYSDDRGDTWAASPSFADVDLSAAKFLAVVPAGPRAGRVVAGGGGWGLATSDDGAATWQPTAEWGYFELSTLGLGLLEGGAPDGGPRLLAVLNGPAYPGNVLLASDDGGDTWAEVWQFPDNPTTHHFVDLGGSAALAVSRFGQVFGTADGGASWVEVGIVPYSIHAEGDSNAGDVRWTWLGPDRRLYVGGGRLSSGTSVNRGYTWRTTEAVAVAAGEAAPESGALGVAVRPNPSAGGTVTVKLSGDGAARAMVVDARGRTVAELYAGELWGGRTVELDTSAWAAGVYTVVVETEGARRAIPFTIAR